MNDPLIYQWALVLLFGIGFFFVAPFSRSVSEFFTAKSGKGKAPGVFLLTSSLTISWIFAKSITNAADLGAEFGLVGGIGYGIYYLSFITAGVVLVQLRVKGGFTSIHHFLQSRFGRTAVTVFSLLIGIRLFNEVWSNSMVIGNYFGAVGTTGYYAAILAFTALTLAYSLKGGLRSSMLTDAIQMAFFGLLLALILGFILPRPEVSVKAYLGSGTWSWATGGNFALLALLQVFSYPFHDPVLTDRGFLSDPKTTLRSYLLAAVVGFTCIVLFSFTGIFATQHGLHGPAAVAVGQLLGIGAMLAMNLIMVTSAASTLDSALASFSKLTVIDLAGRKGPTDLDAHALPQGRSEVKVRRGRWMMVLLAVAGTLPVFAGPAILSATTISGTMVMGLAPVFLLWNVKAPRASFQLSVWFGVCVGLLSIFDLIPKALVLTDGKYADLLWANAWGMIGCFVLYILPIAIRRKSTHHRPDQLAA